MAKNPETKVTFRVFNQEFTKSMSQMETSTKALKQELKLEQEQLKLTGSESDKLSSVTNNLQKQFEIAQQKTKATADQLEAVRQKFGENSKAVADMETKLRSAQIAEQQLANRISQTNDQLEKAIQVESESSSESTKRLQTLQTLAREQDQLKVSSERLTSEYKLQQSVLGDNASEADKLASAESHVAKQSDITKQSISNLSSQLDLVKKEYGNNSTEAQKLEKKILDLRTAEQKLQNSLSEAKANFQTHGQAMKDSAKDADKAKDAIGELGVEIENVAGALVAGGGIAGILDQALDTSTLNTKIDITLDVPKESVQSVKDAIKGIEAYGIDAETALSGVRKQWALNSEATDEVNSKIVKGAGMIARNYEGIDFAELIQETNEVATALGISNEEALGLMNSLLKAGFPPEQLDIIAEYGTQLQAAGYSAEEIQNIFAAGVDTKSWNIDNLLDGIKEGRIQMADFGSGISKELDGILKQTDISASQFKKWGQEIAEGGEGGQVAMNEVTRALAGVKDETVRNQLGTQMFGTMWEDQGMKVVDTLLNAKEGTADLGEGVKQLNDDISKTDDDPIVKIQNAFGKMKTAMEPALAIIADVVGKMADWAAENPTLVATIAAVASGIGILLGIFMALAPVFITITGAAGLFNAAMLPTAAVIGGIVLAIGLLIAAGVLLYKNWDEIKEYASVAWGAIKDFLSKTWEGIKKTAEIVWNGITDFFKKWGPTILTVISGPIGWIVALIKNNWDTIKSSTSKIWDSIKSFISKVWDGIKSTVSSSIDSVKTKINNIWNGIKSTTSSVWNGIKNVINGVWSGIKTAASNSVNWVKTKITGVWNGIKSTTTSVWNGIKKAMTDPVETAKDKISGIIDKIKGFFEKLKLKIPTPSLPKLPHFSLETGTRSIMGKSITYPTGFNVDWYAKGGYFNQPSIIGIGEAGPEMALPLVGKRMAPFADAVANRMLSSLPRMADDKMVQNTSNANVTFNVTVRNDRDMDRLIETVDEGINFKSTRRKVAWGRK